MKLSRTLAPLAIVFTIAAVPPASAHDPNELADLVDTLLPSTVFIEVTEKAQAAPALPQDLPPQLEEFFKQLVPEADPNAPPATGLGSGFIIKSDGYIVTNNHVVNGASEIKVTFYDDKNNPNDGETLTATLVGVDELTDLAVLKVDAARVLPTVTFGDSGKLRVGHSVIAIGNPLGMAWTVTTGIVSALDRAYSNNPYDDFIQTDTAINRGNSGGALFNYSGEVVGVNAAIFSPTGGSIGIGFSIPSNMVEKVAGQIIEHGEVQRGWLGINLTNLSAENAGKLGLALHQGALVESTRTGGPAAAAGLKAGDVILKFNGERIDDTSELIRLAALSPIGTEAHVTVLRDGTEMSFDVEIGPRPVDKPGLPGMLQTQPAPAPAP